MKRKAGKKARKRNGKDQEAFNRLGAIMEEPSRGPVRMETFAKMTRKAGYENIFTLTGRECRHPACMVYELCLKAKWVVHGGQKAMPSSYLLII